MCRETHVSTRYESASIARIASPSIGKAHHNRTSRTRTISRWGMCGAQGVEMTKDKDILAGSTVAAEGDRKHRVVIIGGGFAGIHAAKALANSAVDVTLIDRRNHHTFQPLLYQVALAVLPTSDIASPIRTILRMARNVEVVMDEVVTFDLKNRQVFLDSGIQLKYDYLIVATGATHSYF